MEKIRDKDPGAYHWLRDNEKLELWARFKFDPTLKCDDNTNNFVESFNHAILKFRGLPILTMLEEIRKLIGSRFVTRFDKSQKWNGKIVPYVHKKLLQIEMESRNCKNLLHAGQGEFDVMEGHTNFTVRLQDKFCDCRKWQLTGLPCKHAARCILRMKQQLEDYVDDCFTVDTYRQLYNHIVHPISAPQMWESRDLPTLDPPYVQRRTGRPPEHKRRESLHTSIPESSSQQIPTTVFGSGTTRYKIHFILMFVICMCSLYITNTRMSPFDMLIRCRKCKQLGHNSTTCGRRRDASGRVLDKRKRKQAEGRVPKRRGRPKKQKVDNPAPCPSTQASQVGRTPAS